MAGLAGLAWAARAPLLRGAADLWIVSDPLTPADVAVVLGGGLDVRPFAAAELYHKGLVKKVLVSQVADGRAVAIGAQPGHTEINRQVLLKLGVPADAIETFGSSNKNTKEEALALLEWAQRHASRAVIIPVRESSKRDVCAGLSATSLRVNPSVSRSLHLTRRNTRARIGGKTISGSSYSRMRSSNSSITD